MAFHATQTTFHHVDTLLKVDQINRISKWQSRKSLLKRDGKEKQHRWSPQEVGVLKGLVPRENEVEKPGYS